MKITKNEFWVDGITDKDFAKIYLHLEAHKKKGDEIKTVRQNELIWTLEIGMWAIVSFNKKDGRVLVSTPPENHKILKEMFYHYMQCSCQLDKIIEETNTFEEALSRLKIVSNKQEKPKP